MKFDEQIQALQSVAFELGWFAHAMEAARLEADPSYTVELRNPYGVSPLGEPVEMEDA
jgi:hypothetical protein